MDLEGRICGSEPIDLPVLDPAYKADPHRLYARLREEGRSVVRIRLPTGVEGWLVTGFDAARAVLCDARMSKRAPAPPTTPTHSLFSHLLTLDPPEHTRLRSIVAREFSARRIATLRPRIVEFAESLLGQAAACDPVELMQAYALPLPLRIICGLIGVPVDDEARVLEWSWGLAAADLDDVSQVPAITDQLHDYLSGLASAQRDGPDDTVLGALARAERRGELREPEVAALAYLLLMAGHETTAHLIGNGVLALTRDRSQWDRLCRNPGLAPALVEELLRVESPLEVATARYATAEITLEGRCIRPGELVFVSLAAANRDPGRYASAAEIKPGRESVGSHVAFGHGIHFCAGAALARLEGEIALSTLARRFPRLEIAVPIDALEWMPGLILRGLRSLPVHLDGRRAA